MINVGLRGAPASQGSGAGGIFMWGVEKKLGNAKYACLPDAVARRIIPRDYTHSEEAPFPGAGGGFPGIGGSINGIDACCLSPSECMISVKQLVLEEIYLKRKKVASISSALELLLSTKVPQLNCVVGETTAAELPFQTKRCVLSAINAIRKQESVPEYVLASEREIKSHNYVEQVLFPLLQILTGNVYEVRVKFRDTNWPLSYSAQEGAFVRNTIQGICGDYLWEAYDSFKPRKQELVIQKANPRGENFLYQKEESFCEWSKEELICALICPSLDLASQVSRGMEEEIVLNPKLKKLGICGLVSERRYVPAEFGYNAVA